MARLLCIPSSRCAHCDGDFIGMGAGLCQPCEATMTELGSRARGKVLQRKAVKSAMYTRWARIWRDQLREERAAGAEA